MRILLIDNRDSFTFSLAEACRTEGATVEVTRNSVAAADAFDRARRSEAVLMLSPGPGGPGEAGCCVELIARAARRIPLIGICLGPQAIVAQAGGAVVRAAEACHGKCSAVSHTGAGPFAGLPSPMQVGRYHSLCTPTDRVPPRLRVLASLEGMAMAVCDEEAGQLGLQFHPESILTPLGGRLTRSMLAWAEERRAAFARLTARAPRGKVAA